MRTAHLDFKVFAVAKIISYTVEAYTESSFNGCAVPSERDHTDLLSIELCRRRNAGLQEP